MTQIPGRYILSRLRRPIFFIDVVAVAFGCIEGTNYFIADYAGIDKSIFDIDKDALKYDFYTIDIAINKMKKQYENFSDEKQKPIFEYRLKVLNIIKEKYL